MNMTAEGVGAEAATTDWQIGTFIVASVTAFIMLLAAFAAMRQVWATRKSTNLQIAVGLYEHLLSTDSRDLIRLIYSTKPEDLNNLPREKLQEIEIMLNWLDMVGYLVERGVIEEGLAVKAFGGPPALRCWHQMTQYIEKARLVRGGHYLCGLESFARSTVKYQIRNIPRKQWIILFYLGLLEKEVRVNLIEKELRERDLLSAWERRLAIIGRILRSICDKELREELLKDKGFRDALIKAIR